MRLPLFVDLAGRRVLVVGGGQVAVRRVARLRDGGASVTVVAPVIDGALDMPGVSTVRREFTDGDLDGMWLVLACTDDPAVNAGVAAAAEARRLWCVRADVAEQSPAWLAASAEIDDLTVAVSASGDPARALAVRDAVELGLRSGELTARRGRSTAGRVVLVGGGPGDPDLLTLKGFRLLLDADVVVADRLAPTDLLSRLPADIEVIDVGKEPRGAATPQDEINALLITRATAGQRVVRLKGGDPFVLGRGTEEVDACVAAGITVEVIPGVTSATAAATLAGIPLTERGTTQQFTVVSGHLPPGHAGSTVDWPALAVSDATLVLLMAVANLEAIVSALIDGGRRGETASAVIENASLPSQRVFTGRLDEIAGVATGADVVPPAIVVIGDVVRL